MFSHELFDPVPHCPSPPAQAQLGTESTHKESTVGGTPVVWMDKPFTTDGRGFWAKLEGHNPGAMKDRPALHMVARAKDRGELQPGGLIVESTSGTLGLGLRWQGSSTTIR
jgi:cysteine synthase